MPDVMRDEASVVDAPVRTVERRRPGRIAKVNPALIPLLRGEAGSLPDREDHQDSDEVRAPTGIAVSMLISGMFWLAVFWII